MAASRAAAALGRLFRRAIRSRPGRAVMATGGIAGAALLVLVLLAAWRSLETGVRSYAGQAGCDLWVAPRGTDNLVRSGGFLGAAVEREVRLLTGVDGADPVLRTFVTASAGRGDTARRLTLLAIAHRGAGALGGPVGRIAGRAAAGPGEVVLDRAAAHRLGVGVGGEIEVNDEPWRVVGLTRGTNLIATQFAFADLAAVEDVTGLWDRASFLLVRLRPGADADGVARAIAERVPGVAVFRRDAFVANNLREVNAGFVPLLAVLCTVGLGVAGVLVALLAHGLVEDRRADIAVLFALGAAPAAVARRVVAHVEGIVLVGSLLGALLSHLLGAALDHALPTVELAFGPADALAVAALLLLAGALGAAVPVVRLERIDPLEAFRP